ncbi:MAG: hypothetical protein IKL82_04260 [Clostridia bacterium]|nr:hypothetical protein [Clostridia bacterium]
MEELLDFIIEFTLDVYCDLVTELIPSKNLTKKQVKLLKLLGGIVSFIIVLVIITGGVLVINQIKYGLLILIIGIVLLLAHVITAIVLYVKKNKKTIE